MQHLKEQFSFIYFYPWSAVFFCHWRSIHQSAYPRLFLPQQTSHYHKHTYHEPTHLFSFPSISPNCTNEDLSSTINTCAYSSRFTGLQYPSLRNSFRNGLQLDALPVVLLPHPPQGRAVFAIGSKVPKDTSSCLERIRNSTDAPAVSGSEPAAAPRHTGTAKGWAVLSESCRCCSYPSSLAAQHAPSWPLVLSWSLLLLLYLSLCTVEEALGIAVEKIDALMWIVYGASWKILWGVGNWGNILNSPALGWASR